MLMVQNKSLLVQNKKKPMLRLRVSVCIGKQQTHFGLKLLRLSVMDHFRNYLNFTKDALVGPNCYKLKNIGIKEMNCFFLGEKHF